MNTKQLIEAVRKVAAENPGRKFSEDYGCKYFEDYYDENEDCFRPTSKPCCIVGHGFASLGFTSDIFMTENTTRVGVLIADLSNRGEIEGYRQDDTHWLADVQRCQDKGLTWAEAVA